VTFVLISILWVIIIWFRHYRAKNQLLMSTTGEELKRKLRDLDLNTLSWMSMGILVCLFFGVLTSTVKRP
jgi:hypothetical protein